MLAKLGPLDTKAITDLRPFLDAVPDNRSLRGRWYSLTSILLICACATISGAKSIDELAERGQRTHESLLAAIGDGEGADDGSFSGEGVIPMP